MTSYFKLSIIILLGTIIGCEPKKSDLLTKAN
jgi:hypothetical protein